jgi:hypothetical protein
LFPLHKILFFACTIIIGALFLFGAYTKIIGIQNFEWTLAETGFFSFGMANVLSRFLIIIEGIFGFFFLFNNHINKQLYKWAIFLCVFFNIYLVWVMMRYGFSGNCGCFGEVVLMTPLQAYFKNCILIAAIYFLHIKQYAIQHWLSYLVIIGCFAGIGYVIPPDFIFITENDTMLNEPIALQQLYGASADVKPSFDFKKGKHIIGVLSTSCHHCKSAAKKISIMQKRNVQLPFYFVFAGDDASLQLFYKETAAQNVPHQLNKDFTFITTLTGLHATNNMGGFPKILWVQDGKLIRITKNYLNLSESAVEQWLQQP